MRQMILLVLGLIFLGGCASGPQMTKEQPSSLLGQEYVVKVAPISTRTSEGGSCPKQVKAVIGQSWKSQVAAANACVRTGQWAMVETLGQTLAEVHHLGPWGAYFMSLAADARGDTPRANWMIELALKKSPNLSLLVYQQGRLQWKLRDQVAAQKTLRRAVDLDTRLVDAQIILGQMAMTQGDVSEAGKRFRLALDTEPRHLPALLGFAEVSIQKKDAKAAHEVLDQAIFGFPTNLRARVRKAEVLETLDHNLAEALAAYRRVRSLERDRKLDASIDFDLEGKIRQLEGAVIQASPNQLSQSEKKVAK